MRAVLAGRHAGRAMSSRSGAPEFAASDSMVESTYSGCCGARAWTPQLDGEADLPRRRGVRPEQASASTRRRRESRVTAQRFRHNF